MVSNAVLIIGGGLTGIQLALQQSKAGKKVYLVEKCPGLVGEGILPDGNFAADKLFSHADLAELKRNSNIEVVTNADVEQIEEKDGEFKVKVRKKASRIIDGKCDECDDCKACMRVCPVNLWDDYNGRLSFRAAIDSFNPEAGVYNIEREEMPACQQACPVHLDIRGYIGLIADGKFEEALSLIRRQLPFPAICGRICTHPCEQKCNRGTKDEPLAIRGLKRFVADCEVLEKGRPTIPGKAAAGEERVAIVGAGPAGLTCAHDLAQLGYQVTVFESLPVAGGMLHVGIPEYRLPKSILEREIDSIRDLGVEIKTNAPIGKDLTIDDLFGQGFKAMFIAVGAHSSQKLGVPGEEAEGVIHGVDLLRDLNLGHGVKVGRRVAIVGGGNVAMDAARSALRLGAENVSILYRRSREEMPASEEEIEAAEAEGIAINYLVAPTEVLVNDGRVKGVKCTRMELGELDASGRRRPIPIKGSEFEIEVDMLIPAVGQTPVLSFLTESSGIETSRGTIVVDPDSLATTRPGIYAGGDAVTGPATAIGAIAAGKKAAASIDNYIRGTGAQDG